MALGQMIAKGKISSEELRRQMGERIPTCELSEYIVVAKRILDNGEIDKHWYREVKEAIRDLREDYVFPVI